jgi:large subunit ribosomal protein L22
MEAYATQKYIRVSSRKTGQVLGLIRGRDVETALQTLRFTPRPVAKTISKLLQSAVSNAVQKDGTLDPERLVVKEARLGAGPTMKRFLPRAQGRATPLLKRTCHITIIVSDEVKASRGAR